MGTGGPLCPVSHQPEDATTATRPSSLRRSAGGPVWQRLTATVQVFANVVVQVCSPVANRRAVATVAAQRVSNVGPAGSARR